ncbi:hypothetical protein K431DRAFT_344478 [Polychaeton citri CBS 116435]|uniref:Arb2 domain-containing protein n=1 Tax=Polychaeton citri CBS 116435 TaxID=1314669 RepID=A0A9P4QBX3_9PEZI|nr:hypothetical protein K431DRAFT_344478 [Polychaeton citri CBS 116435]
MFCCKNNVKPTDPFYPCDLAALGFKLNEHGQFVKTAKSGSVSSMEDVAINQDPSIRQDSIAEKVDTSDHSKFFDFFHTSSDRANNVRREAFQTCARQEMLKILRELDMQEMFLGCISHSDDPGTSATSQPSNKRPEGPHVSILVSGGLKKLKRKREVVIVVGESCQDLGVWAYRTLLADGGLEKGTAIGLVRALKAWGSDDNCRAERPCSADIVTQIIHDVAIQGHESVNEHVEDNSDVVPGVIIMNPGQLLYSPSMNRSISQASWMARRKGSAIDDVFEIDERYNKVEGHKTSEEHIKTTMSSIPDWVGENARLHLLGVGDGANGMLTFLDAILRQWPILPHTTECKPVLTTAREPHITITDGSISREHASSDFWVSRITAIALCQPTHDHDAIQSQSLKNILAVRGKAWEVATLPKGARVASPATGNPDDEITDTEDSLSHTHDDEGDELPSYRAVSCQTFSAGPDINISECILPAMLEEIVKWFRQNRNIVRRQTMTGA